MSSAVGSARAVGRAAAAPHLQDLLLCQQRLPAMILHAKQSSPVLLKLLLCLLTVWQQRRHWPASTAEWQWKVTTTSTHHHPRTCRGCLNIYALHDVHRCHESCRGSREHGKAGVGDCDY
jgi:hypothetical protein